MSRPDPEQMRPDVAASMSEARSLALFRTARDVFARAQIARECTAPGAGRDLDRAEKLLSEIRAILGSER